jgi:hypothetical protein
VIRERADGGLARLRGGEELVEVRNLGRAVQPRAAHDSVLTDQERRALGDVAEPSVLEGDAEAVRRVGVPVGEQRKVEVERLRPRDVRVRRVA